MSAINLYITNLNRHVDMPAGLSLSEIAKECGITMPYDIVGATVNNKYVSLDYRVYSPKHITFLDVQSPEGRRIYNRSLVLLLYVAVRESLAGVELNVTHSVSKGLYCSLTREGKSYNPTTAETLSLLSRMQELVDEALPIERLEIPTDEATKMLADLPDSVEILKGHGEMYTVVHSLKGHCAVLYGETVQNTRELGTFNLKEFYSGLLLQLPDSTNPTQVSDMSLQSKMFATFLEVDRLTDFLKIRRLSDLNRLIADGEGRHVIHVAEALHEKKIADIANMIADRRDSVKVVLIAGPSSSGKTTFSKRLAIQLTLNGFKPVNLSIDNYFVDRVKTPRDENGNYDFEAVEAINVELFNKQLLQLIDGEEIEIPKYNIVTGLSYFDGDKLQLDPKSILIIEGTHGLTPALTPMIPAENKFKIYVAPLAGINFDTLSRIRTTDNRLVRRIVRDYYTRGRDAEGTINQWPSVRRGEDKFIYANQEEADVMFNSCLVYELSVLKKMAEPILLEVKHNSPHYAEAKRLLHFLSYFNHLDSESVPPTSLLREFLGGSSYVYD